MPLATTQCSERCRCSWSESCAAGPDRDFHDLVAFKWCEAAVTGPVWSRCVLGQGAQVLLITDGLEREVRDALSREMDRLHRSRRKLTRLNPLLRYEGFEPKAAGIRTMLQHVDEMRPVHNLASIEALCEALS